MKKIIIRHAIDKISIEKEANENKFLLTDNGGFFYYNQDSKYRGLFFPEKKGQSWTLFKTLDSVNFFSNEEIKDEVLLNRFDKIERHTDKGIFKYFYLNGCFAIETEFKGNCIITLDMREIYDFDDNGRIYNVFFKKGCIIIEYKKFWNNFLDNLNYTRYLAIKTNCIFENLMNWKEAFYTEDEKRKSYPWKLYVFDAIKLKFDKKSKIVFSYSDDFEIAAYLAKKAFNSAYEEKTKAIAINTNIERLFALNCAVKSLKDLYVDFNGFKGFYAGLPWFFQFWTRDESISLPSIKFINDAKLIEIAKGIILNKLKKIGDDGRIQNREPFSELASADGTGWVFKSAYEFLDYFSHKEISFIRDQLENSIQGHIKNYSDYLIGEFSDNLPNGLTKGILIRNNQNETWMDTSYNNDTREGFRIEIQALWLLMLKLANKLDRDLLHKEKYFELEKKTKEKVKDVFFNNGFLKDGKDDLTIRPNIFLAYYIYPDLLEKEEWERVFDNSIEKLWLDWGGFSTIQKDSSLFFPDYTGEDNKSYHRGDSWFFINNIAAICLIKLNKEKYIKYIEKIIESSTKDILYMGIIARASELSSASSQKAQASLFQLWSSATLIELIYLLE